MKPVVDVCVATFKRPERLRKTLLTLLDQETEERFDLLIHVADNDASRSAEPVVRELGASGRPISYDVEPVQSISLARNRSMQAARGEFIAITDDDLYADRRWLLTLFEAMAEYQADVVHGPVLALFPPGTPAYVPEFFKVRDRPTGATDHIYTAANVLFRRSLIEGRAEPFDPHWGLTGGEDTVFFNQLRDRGCRIVWCREALVFGDVPPYRATLRWIVQRRFRIGNNAPRHATFNWRDAGYAARESLFLVLGFPLVFLRPGRRMNLARRWAHLLIQLAFLAGVLAHLAGYRYEEYRTTAEAGG